MTSDRVLLTLAMVAMVAALYLLMLKGWRSRLRRQRDLPPLPLPPAEPGDAVLPAVPGLFVGTTFADDWLDRVAVHGLAHRSAGWLRLDTDGVHVEREGMAELYLPYRDVERAVLGDALAGKFIGREGMVLLDWRLGDRLLTSGFRADDHAAHHRVVEAVTARLPVPDHSAPDGTASDRPTDLEARP